MVNNRANYGRIKSFLSAVQDHPDLKLQLIVGASAVLYRFGSVVDIIRKDGFDPVSVVYSIVEGETTSTMAKSTGLSILKLATQFESLKLDIVLTVADRLETMNTVLVILANAWREKSLQVKVNLVPSTERFSASAWCTSSRNVLHIA